MIGKLKTLLAGLSVTAMVAIGIGLIFAGGELRQGFRAACSSPTSGWLTRHVCDWLDVVKLTPPGSVVLDDSDAAANADRSAIPDGTVGAGLEKLDLQKKDLVELERLLERDLDGDGVIGRVTPRAKGEKRPRAETVVADKEAPSTTRGSRVVVTAPEQPPTPDDPATEKDESTPGVPAAVTVIPNEVPKREWLHEIDWQLKATLPLAGKKFAEEIDLSARWMFAREHALNFGLEPYGKRLSERERQATGKEFDWGVKGVLVVKCHGLFDCKPR